jgi:hypothetical protein
LPDISIPEKSGLEMPTTDNVNDVTMGLVGDISDIIPENSQQIN